MSKFQKATFNKNLAPGEVEVFCHFCGARRTYWKGAVKRMKKPFRCKTCAGKIRRKEMEDVVHNHDHLDGRSDGPKEET